MTQLEYEAYNETPPLKNSQAMKCVAVLVLTSASQVADLKTLFGQLGPGHFLTAQADGQKAYVALGSASGTIDPAATGVSTLAAWPLADGQRMRVWASNGGREQATGVATSVQYDQLHYIAAVATGTLRIYRSSVGQNQDTANQFKAP